MTGWFAMSRAMFDHDLFKGRADRVGAWAWMLATAAWKETKQDIGGEIVTIRRGEFCASQAMIEAATGMPRQQLRSFMEALKREGAITTRPAQKSTKARTIVTICKYEKYQSLPQEGNQGSTKEQPIKEQRNNIPVGEDDKSTSSEVVVFEGVRGTVWRVGRALLARHGVTNASIIGKWIKDAKSASRVLELIEAAEIAQTEDPISYITKAVQGKTRSDRQADEEKAARIARWGKIQ